MILLDLSKIYDKRFLCAMIIFYSLLNISFKYILINQKLSFYPENTVEIKIKKFKFLV